MKEKNVIMIASVFPPEPVVSAIIAGDVANELSKRYNVTVLCPKSSRPLGFKFDKDMETEAEKPYKRITLDSYVFPESKLIGRFIEILSMGKHAVKYLKEHHKEVDLIYNAPWPLFGRYMVALTARKYNIPYITPVQDLYPEALLAKIPKWKWFQWLVLKLLSPFDRVTLRNAAKVYTISDKMKTYLMKTRGMDEDRFVVVRHWQNEEMFIKYHEEHYVTARNAGSFTFMYCGNIGPLARIELVIDAFVKANITDTRLIIAGSGSAKEGLQKRAMLYPGSDIQFMEVPNGKVPDIQDKADVMVLPIKKGFSASSIPSKLPAYMLSAKPVIACVDCDSDTAISITEGKCGWVIDPENIDQLVDSFNKAVKMDKNELMEMGQNGLKYAMANFSRKNNFPKLCKVYEDILENS